VTRPGTRLILALTLAGPALAGPMASAEAPSFDYDRKPVALVPAEVAIRNIAYVDASGRRAEATVVAPQSPGRHPGVLFVHWYDSEAQSNSRAQFLPDALALARRGIASLLVDTMWSDPEWFSKRNPADDLQSSLAQVRNLRRALDVLGSLEEVDPGQLAYVGHDFGAMYGAVVAGVDHRAKAWVFIAGTKAFSDWYLLGRKVDAETRAKVQDELAPLDPTRHVGKAAPAPILLQFGTKDRFVPRESADAIVAAAQEPKEAKFYECGHEMNVEAMNDRIVWLQKVLAAPKR
jgi:fermentation-respiration switch protein FrsA (DUF1100 family)